MENERKKNQDEKKKSEKPNEAISRKDEVLEQAKMTDETQDEIFDISCIDCE